MLLRSYFKLVGRRLGIDCVARCLHGSYARKPVSNDSSVWTTWPSPSLSLQLTTRH